MKRFLILLSLLVALLLARLTALLGGEPSCPSELPW
jgi:hypothetical protein